MSNERRVCLRHECLVLAQSTLSTESPEKRANEARQMAMCPEAAQHFFHTTRHRNPLR